ncbi:MAG: GNAT family N-acetyltransferase [Clostridiales bacterium]|nr:GNAT family N-acetyltransferase [Clostridiales bacterium]
MLQDNVMTSIDTIRLILRKFEEIDAEPAYRNWAGRPEVQLNYGEPVYKTVKKTSELIRRYIRAYDKKYSYRWAVIERASGECIGQIAYFLVDPGNEFAEIEYCIGTDYQGKGYATEACKAVIAYGFEKIGLHKVQICVRPSNMPSRKVIEKCGFRSEGTLRDYFRMADGHFEDRMYYSILRDEYAGGEGQ